MFIPLTQGLFARVDEEDYEELSRFTWCAAYCEKSKAFYAIRRIKKAGVWTTERMHRKVTGYPKGKVVDHINHDTLDNRRSNLRICTIAENARNKKLGSKWTSRFRGVCWFKAQSTWRASISVQGRCRYLGQFRDEVEAARAYDRAALLHYGEFANINGV